MTYNIYIMGQNVLKVFKNSLKILGTRRVTWDKVHK